MDNRWRELQRAVQHNPAMLDNFISIALRANCFSEPYQHYLSSLDNPLGSYVVSKKGIMAIERNWKAMYALNRHASYQRIIFFILALLQNLDNYPKFYAEFTKYIDYLKTLFETMSAFGPSNPPSPIDIEQLLVEWNEVFIEITNAGGGLGDLGYSIRGELVSEIARYANHYLQAFLPGNNNCDCCPDTGPVDDWNKILSTPRNFLSLVNIHVYTIKRPSNAGLHRMQRVHQLLRAIIEKKGLVGKWKELSKEEQRSLNSQAVAQMRQESKKLKREMSQMQNALKRQFLGNAEHDVWFHNVFNMVPGQLWN